MDRCYANITKITPTVLNTTSILRHRPNHLDDLVIDRNVVCYVLVHSLFPKLYPETKQTASGLRGYFQWTCAENMQGRTVHLQYTGFVTYAGIFLKVVRIWHNASIRLVLLLSSQAQQSQLTPPLVCSPGVLVHFLLTVQQGSSKNIAKYGGEDNKSWCVPSAVRISEMLSNRQKILFSFFCSARFWLV